MKVIQQPIPFMKITSSLRVIGINPTTLSPNKFLRRTQRNERYNSETANQSVKKTNSLSSIPNENESDLEEIEKNKKQVGINQESEVKRKSQELEVETSQKPKVKKEKINHKNPQDLNQKDEEKSNQNNPLNTSSEIPFEALRLTSIHTIQSLSDDQIFQSPLKVVYPSSQWIESVSISADSKKVATTWSQYNIMVWDLNYPGKPLKKLSGHILDVKSLDFSSDSKKILSISDDRTLRYWNLESPNKTVGWNAHKDPGECCALSKNMKFAVSGGLDKAISVWDLENKKRVGLLTGHSNFIVGLSVSPDSQFIASCSWDSTVRLWKVKEFQEYHVLKGHTDWVTCCKFSRDGKYLISGSSDFSLRVWDVQTGSQIHILNGHTHCVEDVAVDIYENSKFTNNLCISSSHDFSIRLWDFLEGTCLACMVFDSYIPSLSWCGYHVVCGDTTGKIHFLQLVYPKKKSLVMKEGFLIKQGFGHKNWKKRWFKLGCHKLEYFENSKSKKFKGEIPILYNKVRENRSLNKKWGFEIETKERTYYCVAQSKEEMLSWISAIKTNSRIDHI
eukprot:Anaeramoba_ignava/c19616_g2_i1.p1 GENE.c19616_g2_i1~~c19616_g2_i1.p1  ORF type:complete len:561 (+),score=160.55 c19616_g2_i1:932-2614(+)